MSAEKLLLAMDKWDSDFFNKKIGNVIFKRITSSNKKLKNKILNVLDYAQKNKYDFLVCKTVKNNRNINKILKACGFNEVSANIDFKQKLLKKNKYSLICNDVFEFKKCVEKNELDQAKKIAQKAFSYSRFYAMGVAGKRKIDQYHAAWLENIYNDKKSKIFIAVLRQKVAGFIAVSFTGNNVRIILIAVKNTKKGRGVGSLLVKRAMEKFKNDSKTVYVKTQKDNIPAVNFYKKLGFKICAQEIVFFKKINK